MIPNLKSQSASFHMPIVTQLEANKRRTHMCFDDGRVTGAARVEWR
jgi:hypothetical protein